MLARPVEERETSLAERRAACIALLELARGAALARGDTRAAAQAKAALATWTQVVAPTRRRVLADPDDRARWRGGGVRARHGGPCGGCTEPIAAGDDAWYGAYGSDDAPGEPALMCWSCARDAGLTVGPPDAEPEPAAVADWGEAVLEALDTHSLRAWARARALQRRALARSSRAGRRGEGSRPTPPPPPAERARAGVAAVTTLLDAMHACDRPADRLRAAHRLLLTAGLAPEGARVRPERRRRRRA